MFTSLGLLCPLVGIVLFFIYIIEEMSLMLNQYPKLQAAVATINDDELIALVEQLKPFLGTEDGKKANTFLSLFMDASRAIAQSDKTSRFVWKRGNNIRRAALPNAIHFKRTVAYSENLYPVVNDEGDEIIDKIMERVIELLK